MTSGEAPVPGSREWHELVDEEVADPDLPIVDPHHHLWRGADYGRDYLLDDLRADTGSGHRVERTVFVECGAAFRTDGPEYLRPVGETEFVATIATTSDDELGARIAGIVSHADLRLGDVLPQVLDAHTEVGRGLFRGIRHRAARAHHPTEMWEAARAPAGLYLDASFVDGVHQLGHRGLTFDAWHYHHQMYEFLGMARSATDTVIVLNHFGTPVGVGGGNAPCRGEVFEQWRADIAEAAQCPNVVAKLGGLAMPDNGYGWHLADRPPTSDEVMAAQRDYYLYTIDCFGPDRCMFESNFPVDRQSLSYRTLYNAFKKMVADFSDDERSDLFSGTAERVYRL